MHSAVSRLLEIGHLLLSFTEGWSARRELLRVYRAALADPTCSEQTVLPIRLAGQRFPFHLRMADIYTLAEILHEEQYFLETPVPAEPIILDAGANVGATGVWWVAHHPGATLHCFEPEPANFALLQANLGDRPRVGLHQVALGEEEGTANLHVAEHGAMHTMADASVGTSEVEVPVWRLDRFLERHDLPRVDILKLDVEGFEMEVLRGFGERLRDVGIIAGEVHEDWVDPAAFYALLQEAGFTVVSKRPVTNPDENVHLFEAARA